MIRALVAITFLQGIPSTLAAYPQDTKSPVPTKGEREIVSKQLKDIFKAEYSKRDPESRVAFSKKLLVEAATTNDPTPRFVMLTEARDLAAQAGDIETAFAAVDRISRKFDVSSADTEWASGTQKLNILARARKMARTRDAAEAIAYAYLRLAREGLEDGNYKVASEAAKNGGTVARTARASGLVSEAKALAKEIREIEKEFMVVQTAEFTLSVDPADPEANLTVGRFYCFVRDDWDKGLPCLAISGNVPLEKVAQMELEKPMDVPGQVAIGDGWFDLAKKERRKIGKDRYLARAWKWYEEALQQARGLAKLTLEKKINTLTKSQKLKTGRDVTRGLIARWGFDDPGRPGYETRGRYHAKPSAAGAKWIRDPVRGGVMSFDGSGAHLILPANPQTGHKSGTWAFWFNLPNAPPASSYSNQFYIQETSVWIALSNGGVGIDLNSGSGWFDTNGGRALGAIAGKGKITPNQWHHIAFSWDGKMVRCYHNGVLTSEAPTVGPKAKSQVAKLGPGTTRAIGSRVSSSSTYLNGRIDEFRIYGLALSDREVMAIYRATYFGRPR